jgi:hypothetical protein
MSRGIEYQYFPKSMVVPALLTRVAGIFESRHWAIDSAKHDLSSDQVLAEVREGLLELGFMVETGKKKNEKIAVPVLFGPQGRPEKSFEADGFHKEERTVIEVEAGRGVTNYQFLKDIFQTCMMHDVDCLVIAVRKVYKGSHNFETLLNLPVYHANCLAT